MQPREAFHQQTLSYKTYLLTAAQDSSFHTPASTGPSFMAEHQEKKPQTKYNFTTSLCLCLMFSSANHIVLLSRQ